MTWSTRFPRLDAGALVGEGKPSPTSADDIYGFVTIGNGVAFSQGDQTNGPLFARIR